MLKLEEWMDIRTLHREGHSIKEIARQTGRSRNTVRRILRETGPTGFSKPERDSCLDNFKPYLKERFESCGLSAVRLLPEIQAMGYVGSIATLRRYVHALRPEQERIKKLTVRFETAPGKHAQADWAYCGRFPDAAGRIVPVYAFVIVLSFSRLLYVEFTSLMYLPVLIRCHMNAFEFFGGWPLEILYDNMKQVRLSQQELNPLFADFANHYGFAIKTHRIRRPRTKPGGPTDRSSSVGWKGKVERMVQYVKNAFLNGRVFSDFADLSAQAQHWLAHTANTRIHATTGQRPVDLRLREGLTALNSIVAYKLVELVSRKAGYDGFVRFARSRYSLPPEYAGQNVLIGQRENEIVIRAKDMIIAEHAPAQKAGASVADPAHIEALWKLSLNNTQAPPPRWQLNFHQQVEAASLAAYQEAVQ
ncbi:MAG: IS21 family transposase [Terracidiphilus sp.]